MLKLQQQHSADRSPANAHAQSQKGEQHLLSLLGLQAPLPAHNQAAAPPVPFEARPEQGAPVLLSQLLWGSKAAIPSGLTLSNFRRELLMHFASPCLRNQSLILQARMHRPTTTWSTSSSSATAPLEPSRPQRGSPGRSSPPAPSSPCPPVSFTGQQGCKGAVVHAAGEVLLGHVPTRRVVVLVLAEALEVLGHQLLAFAWRCRSSCVTSSTKQADLRDRAEMNPGLRAA
jgi:hypothetical protein